jgi:hypothetical protein
MLAMFCGIMSGAIRTAAVSSAAHVSFLFSVA